MGPCPQRNCANAVKAAYLPSVPHDKDQIVHQALRGPFVGPLFGLCGDQCGH
jgi:hypothetical protein